MAELATSGVMYRGVPLEQMTKDELISALVEQHEMMIAERKQITDEVEFIKFLRSK